MALSVLGVYASCAVVYLLSHVRLFCDRVTVVGSSVHGISQARRQEWVAISFPGNYPNPGMVPMSPVYQADSTTRPPESPFYARGIVKVLPALKLSAKNPAIVRLVYREESGRNSEKRNLKAFSRNACF